METVLFGGNHTLCITKIETLASGIGVKASDRKPITAYRRLPG